jgi:hypothetical protein
MNQVLDLETCPQKMELGYLELDNNPFQEKLDE